MVLTVLEERIVDYTFVKDVSWRLRLCKVAYSFELQYECVLYWIDQSSPSMNIPMKTYLP